MIHFGSIFLGFLFGIFSCFAICFKFNLQNFLESLGFYKNDQKLYNPILKKDLIFKDEKIQILKEDFEVAIDNVIKGDPEFYNQSPKLSPINDELFMAYRKIFYNASRDNEISIQSSTKRQTHLGNLPIDRTVWSKNSWVWISIEDLSSYVNMLKRERRKHSRVNGTRIYFGILDKNYFSPDFLKIGDNKDYIEKKHGAIMPLFVATEREENGDLVDYNKIDKSDCNCGNPPRGCRTCPENCSRCTLRWSLINLINKN